MSWEKRFNELKTYHDMLTLSVNNWLRTCDRNKDGSLLNPLEEQIEQILQLDSARITDTPFYECAICGQFGKICAFCKCGTYLCTEHQYVHEPCRAL
jgi:hypothetical protein